MVTYNKADRDVFAQHVLSAMTTYVYWLDLDGQFLGCNSKMLTLLGLKKEADLYGKTYASFAKKLEWSEKLINNLKHHDRETNKKQTIITHETWLPTENLNEKKIFAYISHSPLFLDKKIAGIIVEITDITHKKKERDALNRKIKQSEKERKRASLYLDRIIAHLPNNVYWVDKDSAILGCNDNVFKSIGLKSRNEIIGLTYEQMSDIYGFPKEATQFWRKCDREVIRTGKPILNVLEPPVEGTDGKTVYHITTRVPLKDENNKVIGVIGISTNIAEMIEKENELRDAKEKAEIANQTKSDFLATVSHELRTPLNGILGMADILQRQDLTKEQIMFVNDIISSGRTLLTLINSILDLSKLEAGELEIVDAPFNVNDVIDDVIKQTSTIAHKKGIKLINEPDHTIPLNLIGDRQRLQQVLINLVGNAVKFTNKGSVTISLACKEKTSKKAMIEFIIKDTGIGITQKDLKIIFDRFRQLDSSYSKRHSGTGLGLDIVRQLVDLMHGKIDIKSTPGKGSIFKITLLFKLAPSTKLNPWFKKNPDIYVLVIEDNLKVGQNILNLINSPKVQLVSSKRANDTLDKAAKRNQHFQVVIISNESFLNKASNIQHLKSAESHLHYPMLISCNGNEESQVIFKHIRLKNNDDKFASELCKAWKTYKHTLASRSDELSKLEPKILLVEDNLINQRVTEHMLKELGCKITIASNGQEAINFFQEKQFDLILMDIGLPDMDGYEATKKIRSLEKPDEELPIIALTAYASANDKQKCLDAGMNNVITKPINRVGLKSALSTWLIAIEEDS